MSEFDVDAREMRVAYSVDCTGYAVRLEDVSGATVESHVETDAPVSFGEDGSRRIDGAAVERLEREARALAERMALKHGLSPDRVVRVEGEAFALEAAGPAFAA